MRPIDAHALLPNNVFYVNESNPMTSLDELLKRIVEAPTIEINGNTSDGYHTFNELYHHRALLFSVIVSQFKDIAWKSKLHHDGTMYDGMFIVGVNTLQGQATYHYDVEPYWNMFNCKELERAPEWDGHTSEQAIERIASLRLLEPFKKAAPVRHSTWDEYENTIVCKACGEKLSIREDGDFVIIEAKEDLKYCPSCGAKMDGGKENDT